MATLTLKALAHRLLQNTIFTEVYISNLPKDHANYSNKHRGILYNRNSQGIKLWNGGMEFPARINTTYAEIMGFPDSKKYYTALRRLNERQI